MTCFFNLKKYDISHLQQKYKTSPVNKPTSLPKMKRIAIFCLSFVLVWATPLQKSPLGKISTKDIDPRIVNGIRAVQGQFPWQASLLVTIGAGLKYCSGSIISEEWILTSAHCLNDMDYVTVSAGSIDTSSDVLVRSSKLIIHKDYNTGDKKYDIGLIKVMTPFTFNANLSAITLGETLLEDGVNVTLSGWGARGDIGTKSYLSYVDLVTIRNSECAAKYEKILEDSIVCAESGTSIVKNPCNGDGGAPLVVNADTNPVQVGLVSFITIDGCESGHPATFTRVASFTNWIRDETGLDITRE
jgi:secreted trypsin-like serine protease